MRIIDANGNTLTDPDMTLGYTVQEQVFVRHHGAVEAVEKVSHLEVVAEYDNGGKDVRRVIDIPAVAAQPAWDEYETVLRYILYTEDELREREIAALEDRLRALYWVSTEIQMGIGTVEDYAAEIAEARELRRKITALKEELANGAS